MSSYDGLGIADVNTMADVSRAPRSSAPRSRSSRSVPAPVRAAAVGLAVAAIVVGAALGGEMMIVSFVGVVAVLVGFGAAAVRWARASRAASAELAERRVSLREARSL